MGQGTGRKPPGKLREACRDFFRQAPTSEEAARFGLTVEEASSVVSYWPDNADALVFFSQLFTQWRTGMSGPTGLDYTAAVSLMEMHAIDKAERLTLFSDLRVLEDEALKVIRAKAKRNG